MSAEEKELTKLLTALLFVFAQHMPSDQDALIEAHSTMTSTRNLIEALKTGRVRLVKGDGWRE